MLIAISQSQNSFLLGDLFEVLEVSLAMLLRKTSDVLTTSRIRPKENPPLAFLASTGGRPAYIITKEMIEQLRETGMNWRSIATCLGISKQTLYRHKIKFGVENNFTGITILPQLGRHIYPLTDIETDNDVLVPKSQIQLADHQLQELQNTNINYFLDTVAIMEGFID